MVVLLCSAYHSSEIRTFSFFRQFGFLFKGYDVDRQRYWWESVQIIRKTCIILFGTFVQEPYQAVILASFVAVISLVAHLELLPYDRWWLNSVESYGLVSLVATQILSLIFLRSEEQTLSQMRDIATEYDERVELQRAIDEANRFAQQSEIESLGVAGSAESDDLLDAESIPSNGTTVDPIDLWREQAESKVLKLAEQWDLIVTVVLLALNATVYLALIATVFYSFRSDAESKRKAVHEAIQHQFTGRPMIRYYTETEKDLFPKQPSEPTVRNPLRAIMTLT